MTSQETQRVETGESVLLLEKRDMGERKRGETVITILPTITMIILRAVPLF